MQPLIRSLFVLLTMSILPMSVEAQDTPPSNGPAVILRGHEGRIMGVDFAPDGSKLVSVSYDKRLRLWDLTNNTSTYRSSSMRTPLEAAVFTPDGKQIVVCGGHLRGGLYELTLRNAASGESVRSFAGHEGRVNRVRLSPDGRWLASSGIDKTIRVWDVATGKPLASLSGHTNHVYGVSFHPDGKQLASSGRDHSVRVWDVTLGKQTHLLEGHTDEVIDVEFSPNGKHLASGSDDRTIRFWDVRTGAELRRLFGHTREVRDICFSPDSRLLATASYDHTLKVWDVSTGTCVATLKHEDAARTVTFSPNGNTLAVACGDHTICLWDVSKFNGPRARAPKREPATASDEEKARGVLKVAKMFSGATRDKWLRKVVDDYPGTKAATEAKSLLGR